MGINFDNFKKLLSEMGGTKEVNPFDNSFKKTGMQPYDNNFKGISPVAKEHEPEFDLTEMSMELDMSMGSFAQNDEKQKKPELATPFQ